MALRIEGDNYRIEWNEYKCEWLGYVKMNTKHSDRTSYPDVQVASDFELDQVMTRVIHHLDDMINHYKEKNPQM